MYEIPTLPYLRLRFTLEAQEPARLPPYHGSMLRGAFGHALRRTVCVMGPAQPCEPCPLRTTCPYPRIFEPLLEGEPPPLLQGQRTAPRPYVFEPSSTQQDFAPGDRLGFDLVLIGQAVELQGYAVVAVERMAPHGLGPGRKRFHLIRVEAPEPDQVLHVAGQWKHREPLPPATPKDTLPATNELRLTFETPVRFTRDGEPVEAFTFRKLAFRMVRRVLEVAHCHVPEAEIDWTFRPLLEQASGVQVERTLRFQDWERYSHRQHTSMRLGGWVGNVTLRGDLQPFAQLLRTAEVLHVGKGTTFGLGRFAIEGGTDSG